MTTDTKEPTFTWDELANDFNEMLLDYIAIFIPATNMVKAKRGEPLVPSIDLLPLDEDGSIEMFKTKHFELEGITTQMYPFLKGLNEEEKYLLTTSSKHFESVLKKFYQHLINLGILVDEIPDSKIDWEKFPE